MCIEKSIYVLVCEYVDAFVSLLLMWMYEYVLRLIATDLSSCLCVALCNTI